MRTLALRLSIVGRAHEVWRWAVHELAITQSMVQAVEDRMDGAWVNAVYLEIGKLSGVVPESVRFCFDLVAEQTTLAHARLEISEPSGRARCRDCGEEFEPTDVIALCRCGSCDAKILDGQQLRIRSVEVT